MRVVDRCFSRLHYSWLTKTVVQQQASQRQSVIHPLMMPRAYEKYPQTLCKCSGAWLSQVSASDKGIGIIRLDVLPNLLSYVGNRQPDNPTWTQNSLGFRQEQPSLFLIQVFEHMRTVDDLHGSAGDRKALCGVSMLD